MRNVVLFGEDYGHEWALCTLVARLALKHGVAVKVTTRSARGGAGAVVRDLSRYLRDVLHGAEPFPDLVLVVTDTNCQGISRRRKALEHVVPKALRPFVVYATPDPHIERWLLLDSRAFKAVLGRGCKAPDAKCEQDRYKSLLCDAVLAAGVTPLLAGLEHAKDIVANMDLNAVAAADKSFRAACEEIEGKLKEWLTEDGGRKPQTGL